MYRKKKLESLIFYEDTTYKNSYKGHLLENIHPSIPPKSPEKKIIKHCLKNLESLTENKGLVPFNLHIERKPIVRTNPHEIQKKVERLPDIKQLEQVRQTRPRLVMTPAVSIDDILDPHSRALIIEEVYTSQTKRANKDIPISYEEEVKAPRPDFPAPANPIFLPRLNPGYVEPEWRMDSVSWDRRQLRTFVDPDMEFWTTFDLYKSCTACKATAQAKRMRKLIR